MTANNASAAAGTLAFAQPANANASIFGLHTQAQTTASVIKTDANSFAFGKPPTASLASETPTTTTVSTPASATSSIFGTSTTMAAPTTVPAPSFSFGSAAVFGQSRPSIGFGATSSTTSGFGVESANSLASLSGMSRPQKKMFGQVKSHDSDRPGTTSLHKLLEQAFHEFGNVRHVICYVQLTVLSPVEVVSTLPLMDSREHL